MFTGFSRSSKKPTGSALQDFPMFFKRLSTSGTFQTFTANTTRCKRLEKRMEIGCPGACQAFNSSEIIS